MSEDDIKQNIRKFYGLRSDMKLFTNPVGNAWVSSSVSNLPGGVLLKHPRRIEYGLCIGSSDLVGWLTINFRGIRFAVFIALEVKTKKGKATQDQLNYIQRVIDGGGIAGVVRCIQDVEDLISEFIKKLEALFEALFKNGQN